MTRKDLWEQVAASQVRRSAKLIGCTKRERLRWLVVFTTTDWKKADQASFKRISKQVATFAGLHGSLSECSSSSSAREDLDQIARQVRDGLLAYTSGISWDLPAVRISRSVIPWSDHPAYDGRWNDMFLLSVADLIDAVGGLLRRCAARGCDIIFVRNKRMIYCSARCSGRERMRRFQRDTDQYKKKRREYYLASLKRRKIGS